MRDADLGEGLNSLSLRRSSTLPPLDRFQSPLPSLPKSTSLKSLFSLRSSSIDSVRKPDRFPNNVEQELSSDLLKKFKRWVMCLALIEFDQDIGADLDCVYPSTEFSSELRSNIAFSSLPEGEITTSGAHTYSFRIKLPSIPEGQKVTKLKTNYDEFLHGFVYYNSVKSDTLRRGSSQRSLVLLTLNHSLVGLYSTIISVLGALYFKECKGETIQSACSEIACWPDLVPGSTLDLPFLGTIHSISIPLASQPQWPISQLHATSSSPIPASIPLTPLSVNLHDNLLNVSKILLLWELVILGEPILISSSDPRSGSELVHHLRNFIRPLLMKGDYRPYLHIHDSDFSSIVNAKKPPPPAMIISSTNPLVLATCAKNSHSWPHVLKIEHAKSGRSSSNSLGLNSSRKRAVKKDKEVTREIEKAFGRGDYLRSDELIFQHLATLTERFLAPLNRYFSTLFLLDNSLDSPNLSTHFLPIQFLSSLSSHGTPLLFRSNSPLNAIQKFYTLFLQSSNFQPWFESRIDSIGSERRSSYLRRLVETDLKSWMNGRGDGEVIELVGRIEREVGILEAEEEGEVEGEEESRVGKRNVVVVERVRKLKNQASRLKMLRGEREAGTTDSESDVGSIY